MGTRANKKGIKLSFQQEEEEEEEETRNKRARRINRDPGAKRIEHYKLQTQRNEQERELLRQEYLKEQEEIKNRKVTIEYDYFDGSSHGGVLKDVVKIGDSVDTILDLARRKSLQHSTSGYRSSDDVMLVKDNIIIPNNYHLYYFHLNKIHTRRGLLIDFTLPIGVKIVNKQWYNRNKHIYPASLWTEFDANVDYTKMVFRDRNGFVLFNQN